VASNELVGKIHHRMPAILEPDSYDRWLSPELDPHDLMISYPSEPLTMWPISTRVNKPENDDPSLLDRTTDLRDAWAPLSSNGQGSLFADHAVVGFGRNGVPTDFGLLTFARLTLLAHVGLQTKL
jgi:SOS response associated peptidase (SRAP)